MTDFNLNDLFGQTGLLGQVGLYNVLLPFLLVFVLIYAILDKIGLFKREEDDKGARSINAVISLIIALFITFSTNYLQWFSAFVSRFTGTTSMILLGILFLILIIGLFTGGTWKEFIERIFTYDDEGNKRWNRGLIIIIIAIAIIMFFVFKGSGGFEGTVGRITIGNIPIATLIVWGIILGLVILVFSMIFRQK